MDRKSLQIVSLRQLDRHPRSFARRAGDADLATVQQDDLARQRQSESEAVRLSRLKGHEEAAGDFIIESDAVIADRDRWRTGRNADVDAPFAVAIAYGIDGIAHEVLDGAPEERGVGARFRFAADA